MSTILYIEDLMSFEEKNTWIYGLSAVVGGLIYAAIVGSQIATTPVDEIDYVIPMIAVIVGAVVVSIVAIIVVSIAAPSEADKRDERDRLINARGDQVGFYVMSILALVPLGLAFAEAEHFWIANSLYAAFVITAAVSSLVKIVSYRRGL
jgi:hypothetical protein